MFTALQFKNFRGFTDLKLDGLKGVNLVVGRNNSGKTSFLEGLAILADPHWIQGIPGLLRSNPGNVEARFYRWLIKDGSLAGTLTGVKPDARSVVGLRRHTPQENASGVLQRLMREAEVGQPFETYLSNEELHCVAPPRQPRLRCRAVSVQLRAPDALVKLFAQAVKRKGGEEQLESLLHSVDDRIRKVRVEPADDGNHIMVDNGLSEMQPLSQAGQGIYRLVSIFSDLIAERPDLCIVDEIENGIHHSLLEKVWKGLAVASEELKIQIFLTTHSQECIEAAHAAFAQRKTYDFSIIQLFRLNDRTEGRVLDRKHIEAAISGEIDLR